MNLFLLQNVKTFKDVKGCDDAKQELEEVVEYLKNPSKFTRLGGKLPKVCIGLVYLCCYFHFVILFCIAIPTVVSLKIDQISGNSSYWIARNGENSACQGTIFLVVMRIEFSYLKYFLFLAPTELRCMGDLVSHLQLAVV